MGLATMIDCSIEAPAPWHLQIFSLTLEEAVGAGPTRRWASTKPSTAVMSSLTSPFCYVFCDFRVVFFLMFILFISERWRWISSSSRAVAPHICQSFVWEPLSHLTELGRDQINWRVIGPVSSSLFYIALITLISHLNCQSQSEMRSMS